MVESSHSCTTFPAQFHGEPIRRALRGIASRGVLFKHFFQYNFKILLVDFLINGGSFADSPEEGCVPLG